MKTITLILIASIILSTGCINIKEKKQIKQETQLLENIKNTPSKDTILLDFVLGWNKQQVNNHIEKLINSKKLYIENQSYYFVIDQFGSITYKAYLEPKFNNSKLTALSILAESSNSQVIISYLFNKKISGLLFEDYRIKDHYWYYTGSNIKVEIYKSLEGNVVLADIVDRFNYIQ